MDDLFFQVWTAGKSTLPVSRRKKHLPAILKHRLPLRPEVVPGSGGMAGIKMVEVQSSRIISYLSEMISDAYGVDRTKVNRRKWFRSRCGMRISQPETPSDARKCLGAGVASKTERVFVHHDEPPSSLVKDESGSRMPLPQRLVSWISTIRDGSRRTLPVLPGRRCRTVPPIMLTESSGQTSVVSSSPSSSSFSVSSASSLSPTSSVRSEDDDELPGLLEVETTAIPRLLRMPVNWPSSKSESIFSADTLRRPGYFHKLRANKKQELHRSSHYVSDFRVMTSPNIFHDQSTNYDSKLGKLSRRTMRHSPFDENHHLNCKKSKNRTTGRGTSGKVAPLPTILQPPQRMRPNHVFRL